jgi:hypothetical protein
MFADSICNRLYSASHSRLVPENVGLQKEQKYNTFACLFTFACHTCMKCGCHRRCCKCPPWASIHNWTWRSLHVSEGGCDVKASKHLAISPHDWLKCERKAGCATISFRLYYIYLIYFFLVANFLFANSQNTQPHFITGMTCKCIVLLFFL